MAESIVRDGESGRAIVSSTGTPVDDILAAIESTGTIEGALRLHPALTSEAVAAALQFARVAVGRETRYAPDPRHGVSEVRERPVQPFNARSSGGAAVADDDEPATVDDQAEFGTLAGALQSATTQRERLLYELDLVESIRDGLQEIADGKGVPHEEVFGRLMERFPG